MNLVVFFCYFNDKRNSEAVKTAMRMQALESLSSSLAMKSGTMRDVSDVWCEGISISIANQRIKKIHENESKNQSKSGKDI